MTLPNGANISQAEIDRVTSALDALAKDPHAPRSLSVNITLHIHNEYPKHVTVGDKTVVVNSLAEERAAKGED